MSSTGQASLTDVGVDSVHPSCHRTSTSGHWTRYRGPGLAAVFRRGAAGASAWASPASAFALAAAARAAGAAAANPAAIALATRISSASWLVTLAGAAGPFAGSTTGACRVSGISGFAAVATARFAAAEPGGVVAAAIGGLTGAATGTCAGGAPAGLPDAAATGCAAAVAAGDFVAPGVTAAAWVFVVTATGAGFPCDCATTGVPASSRPTAQAKARMLFPGGRRCAGRHDRGSRGDRRERRDR